MSASGLREMALRSKSGLKIPTDLFNAQAQGSVNELCITSGTHGEGSRTASFGQDG